MMMEAGDDGLRIMIYDETDIRGWARALKDAKEYTPDPVDDALDYLVEELDLELGLSTSWWAIAYTAVFCTVIPFFLWTWGLRYISATASSVILLIEVVFAIALATVILDERLSFGTIVGGLCIISAIVLASCRARAEIAAGPDVVPEQ